MDMRLTEQQQQLQHTFAQLFTQEYPSAVIRRLERPLGAATDDTPLAEQEAHIWQALVERGATRLPLPEQQGGSGGGLVETVLVAEQIGRSLYQSPYFDTLAAMDIMLSQPPTRAQQTLLSSVADGQRRIALAIREHGARDPGCLSSQMLSAVPYGSGWTVSGEKRFVCCADVVQDLVLLALVDGAPTFFLVPRDRAGIATRRHDDLGRSELYTVTFDAVSLAEQDMIGGVGGAAERYPSALARARVRHAGYLVGLCQELFERTIRFTKQRKQFDRPIAAFQSIAFRLAGFTTEIEVAKLLTYSVAWRADQREDIRQAAGDALALVGDLARTWTAAALQMHGAYGMTEEADVQRFYRRAVVDVQLLGTPAQLRSAASDLSGATAQPHAALVVGG